MLAKMVKAGSGRTLPITGRPKEAPAMLCYLPGRRNGTVKAVAALILSQAFLLGLSWNCANNKSTQAISPSAFINVSCL